MNHCQKYIEEFEKKLPDPCTVNDLVKAGIYNNPQSAAYARKSGKCPDYIVISCSHIVYPKGGVIEYLLKSINKNVKK